MDDLIKYAGWISSALTVGINLYTRSTLGDLILNKLNGRYVSKELHIAKIGEFERRSDELERRIERLEGCFDRAKA